MKTYLGKSLYPNKVTDEEIKNKNTYSGRQISFEHAIQLYREKYGLMGLEEQPLGYKVTENGIVLIYD